MSKNKSVQSRIIETKPIIWKALEFLQDDTKATNVILIEQDVDLDVIILKQEII